LSAIQLKGNATLSVKRPTRRQPRVLPRVKVWLELEGDYVFGHGLAEILAAVDATGSLKEAAAKLGKSYRYVWGRVKEAEQALGQTLVETQVGGQGTRRSFLTEPARRLLADFTALRERMLAVLREEFARRFKP
jgi:molybdate transport system regulatory protein